MIFENYKLIWDNNVDLTYVIDYLQIIAMDYKDIMKCHSLSQNIFERNKFC